MLCVSLPSSIPSEGVSCFSQQVAILQSGVLGMGLVFAPYRPESESDWLGEVGQWSSQPASPRFIRSASVTSQFLPRLIDPCRLQRKV